MPSERDQLAVWLQRALSQPGQSRYVEVDGARLHYLIWNEDQRNYPTLMLLHGFLGHAHWWDFMAPFFLDRYRVVALDLSGMGDSEHRDSYGALRYARDILGAIKQVKIAPVTVVAHSYSGGRTLRACVESPGIIEHAILIDSYINFADTDAMPMFPPLTPRKPYPDLPSARARFRLTPQQSVQWPELVDYVAERSLRRCASGWSWKFDPQIASETEEDGEQVLRSVSARVDYIYGEFSSVVDRARAERITATVPGGRAPVVIPEAHHHIMFDQPLALVSTLRALLV